MPRAVLDVGVGSILRILVAGRGSKDYGGVRVMEPKIALEVAFDIMQPSARHKSGYALRFPRIVRIRDDKPVEEIDTLEVVRRLVALDAPPDSSVADADADTQG